MKRGLVTVAMIGAALFVAPVGSAEAITIPVGGTGTCGELFRTSADSDDTYINACTAGANYTVWVVYFNGFRVGYCGGVQYVGSQADIAAASTYAQGFVFPETCASAYPAQMG